jgi:Phosphodiester glycosidase
VHRFPAHRRGAIASLALLLAATTTAQLTVGVVPVLAREAAASTATFPIAPGVKLTTVHSPAIPQEIRVLTVTQGHGSVLDLFTPSSSYPGYAKPSAMGANGGGIAIVNGDFGARDGRPRHLSIVDGEMWTSGIQDGSVFGVTADGSRAYVGHPDVEIQGRRGTHSWKIATWNAGDPKGRSIAGFSQRGGSTERPSGDPSPTTSDPRFCAARLIPTGPFTWTGPGKAGIARDYTVDAQPEPCPRTPIALQTDPGAVALTARNGDRGGDKIKKLDHADTVRLTWVVKGWPGVVDVIGGQPVLVRDRRNVAPGFHPGASYFYNYNPRTAVGFDKGCADTDLATICHTFIVTVDGRQTDTGWSKGMRLPALANELKSLGAVWALNLDGGGGTVMWVSARDPAYCESLVGAGGCRVDRPSDGAGERVAVVALGVRPAPDVGEPISEG